VKILPLLVEPSEVWPALQAAVAPRPVVVVRCRAPYGQSPEQSCPAPASGAHNEHSSLDTPSQTQRGHRESPEIQNWYQQLKKIGTVMINCLSSFNSYK